MSETKDEIQTASKEGTMASATGSLSRVQDVEVTVSMELGRCERTLDELLELGEQSLIELNRLVGEPIDIRLNGQPFALGEVVTVGENFGVRVKEVLSRTEGQK